MFGFVNDLAVKFYIWSKNRNDKMHIDRSRRLYERTPTFLNDQYKKQKDRFYSSYWQELGLIKLRSFMKSSK